MCGRFAVDIAPEVLAETFGLQVVPTVVPRYNVAPTQQVAVVREDTDGGNRLDLLHWGLIPAWAKERTIAYKMINARSETLLEKPSFRQAYKYRRCVVPVSGFYEWRHEGKEKLPHYIRIRDGLPMLFAGLWESWKSPEGEVVESFTILTTAANKLLESIHERMPVILHPDECGRWLNRHLTDPTPLSVFFQPYPADLLELWPVSPLVNTPKVDSCELIAPICPQKEISTEILRAQ
ncbi:SOS response-associated peptidase [Geomonas anaerohicana]|uniref:Abasic site processing protein n=1 Tax=Geomonas anaerohicana TaxID=2798583 RepID=A0ABS0YC50_9BACT|nr:SOS response-associated peptidase [Geomonas anaerohicana]MBJ6749904.1 SOS response-associated peptidase [Geomonas anaerohicana]